MVDYPDVTAVPNDGPTDVRVATRGARFSARPGSRPDPRGPGLRVTRDGCAADSELAAEDDRPYVGPVRFEWDPRKAAANLLAHEVRFAEAVTVFDDDFALTREDDDALLERRFITLGLSDQGVLLVVVYAYRDPDIIRIISAWKASRRQRLTYEENRS